MIELIQNFKHLKLTVQLSVGFVLMKDICMSPFTLLIMGYPEYINRSENNYMYICRINLGRKNLGSGVGQLKLMNQSLLSLVLWAKNTKFGF